MGSVESYRSTTCHIPEDLNISAQIDIYSSSPTEWFYRKIMIQNLVMVYEQAYS